MEAVTKFHDERDILPDPPIGGQAIDMWRRPTNTVTCCSPPQELTTANGIR